MNIHKILNNNVVIVLNTRGQEIIAMGKGLGFGKKQGEPINLENIERIFVPLDYQEIKELKEPAAKLHKKCVAITTEIMQKAKSLLKEEIKEYLFTLLSEYLYHIVEQYKNKEGYPEDTRLHLDVQIHYPDEYEIGLYALDLIDKELNIKLPTHEASFIALIFLLNR